MTVLWQEPQNYSFLLVQLLSLLLIITGLLILMLRKNLLVLLMGMELMLNGCLLSLVSFSHQYQLLEGQSQVFILLAIAAAESAIGLSLMIAFYRHSGSVHTEQAELLKL